MVQADTNLPLLLSTSVAQMSFLRLTLISSQKSCVMFVGWFMRAFDAVSELVGPIRMLKPS